MQRGSSAARRLTSVLRVDAITVDLLKLTRAAMPEVLLRPGATVVARVLEREGSVGRLSLAGATFDAQLPESMKPGQAVKLHVVEASADRLLLRAESPPVAQPPVAAVPLP